MKRIVYRVERPRKKINGAECSHYQGPYHTETRRRLSGSTVDWLMKRPMPNWNTWDCQEYVYGFACMDTLKDWFVDPALIELSRIGFIVAKYEVEDRYVIEDDNQIAFHHKHGRRVKYVHCAQLQMLEAA